MLSGYYRLTVVGCALSWFLVGLHLPTIHEMTHHGGAVAWSVVAVVGLLAVLAIAGLWMLLTGQGLTARSSGPDATAS